MSLKKIFFQLTIIAIMLNISIDVHAQPFSQTGSIVEKEYEIHGFVGGLKDGEKLFFWPVEAAPDEGSLIDSAIVENNEFVLKGVIRNGPRFYRLHWSQFPTRELHLLIDGGEHVTIKIDDITQRKYDRPFIDQMPSVEIIGSPSNNARNALDPILIYYEHIMSSLDHSLRNMSDSIGFDPSFVTDIEDFKIILNEQLYRSLSGPDRKDALPIIIYWSFWFINRSHIMVDLYNKLDSDQKKSFYGKKIKDEAILSGGQPFPEFTLNNSTGGQLSSKEIISKSKLTLFYFWSNKSNYPLFMDNMMRLYKKYHPLGFTAVGIFNGTSEDSWHKLMKRYNLPWYNVADLKGDEGLSENVYHYTNMLDPVCTLVDGKGNIVSWMSSFAALQELQWYLWKTFGQQMQ